MPRLALASRFSGSHSVYFDEEALLTVEWYDHGPHAPYESANMLIFDIEQQGALADALEIPAGERSIEHLMSTIQQRFPSYFEVSGFCQKLGLQYTKKVNFWP